MNDAFTGTTRLLAAGQDVYWLKTEFTAKGRTYPAGTIYIPAKPTTAAVVRTLASELGLNFDGIADEAAGRGVQAAASAHRAVGPLRRLAGFRAHSLDVRAGLSHALSNWSIRRRSTPAA